MPASLQIEWTDKDGQPMGEERSLLRDGKLTLIAPPGGAGLRVVGGGFSSRAVAISGLSRLGSLGLEPTGAVEISGLRGKEERTFLWIAPGPPQKPDRVREPRPPDVIRERKISTDGQPAVARLELPPGKYVLAIDGLDGFAPVVFPELQIEPKGTIGLSVPPENGRLLTVLARDRDSRKALRNAKVFVDPGAAPAQRLLQTIFQRRSGSSGEDGRLRIGRIASQEVSVAISALGGRRTTTLIRAGTEAESREVLLAPFQRIQVSLTGFPRHEARPFVTAGRCDAIETWIEKVDESDLNRTARRQRVFLRRKAAE